MFFGEWTLCPKFILNNKIASNREIFITYMLQKSKTKEDGLIYGIDLKHSIKNVQYMMGDYV